jgi:hypothetical protein
VRLKDLYFTFKGMARAEMMSATAVLQYHALATCKNHDTVNQYAAAI